MVSNGNRRGWASRRRGLDRFGLGKLTAFDWVGVILLGGVLAALAEVWRLPGIPFELSEDVAVSAGLRPPSVPMSGLWSLLAAGVFGAVGLDLGCGILRWMGHVALGLELLLGFLILNEVMPGALRPWISRTGWSRRVIRVATLLGAFLFACSDPLWRTGQFFSSTTLHLLATLLAVFLFLQGLRSLRAFRLLPPMLLAGLLAADTPAGLALGFLMLVVCRVVAETDAENLYNPLAIPVVRVSVMRRMSFVFALGWGLGLAVNTGFFFRWGGLEALGWDVPTYVVRSVLQYVKAVTSTASASGWFFMVLVALVPFVLSMVFLRSSVDDDQFLPAMNGVFFAFVGTFSFLQLSGWSPFWFWTWIESPTMVGSGYLLGVASFLSAVTVTCALLVLGVEIFFRNYRRITACRYQDAVEESCCAAQIVASFRPLDRVKRTACLLTPIVVVALVLPYRTQTTAREMAGVVEDYLRDTVRECGDARLMLTDGAMDAAVEVAAARAGHPLKVLPPRDWTQEKPERMEEVVLQMGTEAWRRGKMPLAAYGGFVARPLGLPPTVAEAGTRRAHALGERILALYRTAKPMKVPDEPLKNAFLLVQWRLARMAQLRATACDAVRKTATAMDETDRANALDDLNASLQRVRRKLNWVDRRLNARLTPREGLMLGLDRADFRLARTYARQILASDPSDIAANFAMGMSFFEEESYARAEIHLKRCLAGKSNEPTLLNNLALTQLRMGNLVAAEANARHAILQNPDLAEPRQTLDEIRRQLARRSRGVKGGGTGPTGPTRPTGHGRRDNLTPGKRAGEI